MAQVTVTTEFTKLLDATLAGFDQVAIDLFNQGGEAFAGCEVRLKSNKDSPGVVWQNTAEEWTQPVSTSNIVRVSKQSDPTTLAPGQAMSFVIDCLKGFYSIELWAKVQSGETTAQAFIGRG